MLSPVYVNRLELWGDWVSLSWSLKVGPLTCLSPWKDSSSVGGPKRDFQPLVMHSLKSEVRGTCTSSLIIDCISMFCLNNFFSGSNTTVSKSHCTQDHRVSVGFSNFWFVCWYQPRADCSSFTGASLQRLDISDKTSASNWWLALFFTDCYLP